MIVEYKKLKYGYDEDGWDEVYKSEYKDFNKLRLKLLLEDIAIYDVTQEIFKIILEYRNADHKVNLLDIGCGAAPQLALVSSFCDNAVGFDISEEIVKDNNALDIKAEFIKGDALNHPKFDIKFNLVLMAGVLYSINEKRETHKKTLQEAYNSLEKDGTFIFYHRGYQNVLTYIDKKLKGLFAKKEGEYYMCYFDDAYITSILKEVGFTIKEIKKTDFAYSLTATFFRYLFAKKRYWNYASYKEYTSGYRKEFNSYNKLNILGKIVYLFSKYGFNSLSARTSIFILTKKD